jgi:hypothetical protein
VVVKVEQDTDSAQPTVVDTANALTQFEGSANCASSSQQDCIYVPHIKRIKTEESDGKKIVICTNDSEVISVVRTDDTDEEDDTHGDNSNTELPYENSSVDVESSGINLMVKMEPPEEEDLWCVPSTAFLT